MAKAAVADVMPGLRICFGAPETLDDSFVWLSYQIERAGSPASGVTHAGDAQVQR